MNSDIPAALRALIVQPSAAIAHTLFRATLGYHG